MKKIIITGGDCSGKTLLANNIAKAYNNVVNLGFRGQNIKKLHPFIFDQVTKETDLIIIDDVNEKSFQIFESLIYTEKIIVNKKYSCEHAYEMPDLIFTFSGSVEYFRNYGVSFSMRCKFIRTWIDPDGVSGNRIFMSEEVKFFKELKTNILS